MAAHSHANAHRPHHFVVFVLDDVAVSDVGAGDVEACLDVCDLPWKGNHGALLAGFPRLGADRRSHRRGRRDGHAFFISDERLAINHLEHHLVQMNGVSVRSDVEDFPNFGIE